MIIVAICTNTHTHTHTHIYIRTKMAKLSKKGATLKSLGEKSCEIKGGSQQMAIAIYSACCLGLLVSMLLYT